MFKLTRRAASANWQVRKRWLQDVNLLLRGESTASNREGDKQRAEERVPMIAAAHF